MESLFTNVFLADLLAHQCDEVGTGGHHWCLDWAVALVISICVEKLVDLKYTQFDHGIWPAFLFLYAK